MAENHFGGASQNPRVCKGRLDRRKIILHCKSTNICKSVIIFLKTDGFLRVRSISYCNLQGLSTAGSPHRIHSPLYQHRKNPSVQALFGENPSKGRDKCKPRRRQVRAKAGTSQRQQRVQAKAITSPSQGDGKPRQRVQGKAVKRPSRPQVQAKGAASPRWKKLQGAATKGSS